jgi:hypothetical protein
LPSLDLRHVGHVDVGLFTQPLLAEPALLAEPSEVGGERAERVEHLFDYR